MREETVTVKIDHPLGSTDEDNPSVVYPINCGYVDVERTAGFSELDKQRVYLLGVDVAVDEYIGELIAVARRRDDPETVWIIAPENISYTIQQIEEMIYFEEQYYDSFVEIVDEELWDAYDENEKLLGFDLKRSQAKSFHSPSVIRQHAPEVSHWRFPYMQGLYPENAFRYLQEPQLPEVHP